MARATDRQHCSRCRVAQARQQQIQQFYAQKLHTAALKAELSSEGVCVNMASRSPLVRERLLIAVLQVNAGIAVEDATDASWDAVAGAFGHRGSL